MIPGVGLPRPPRGADGTQGVWARIEVLSVTGHRAGGMLPAPTTSDRHEVYLGARRLRGDRQVDDDRGGDGRARSGHPTRVRGHALD